MKRLIIVLCVVLVLLALFALPMLAQDTTTNLPTIPLPPVDQAGSAIMAAVLAVLAGLIDSPVTVAITSILKKVLPAQIGPVSLSGGNIQFSVAAIIAVAYWLALHFGVGDAFNSVYGILLTVAPVLAGLFVRQLASQALYEKSKAKGLPFWGYQRAGSGNVG